ncbi:hypothetical protein E4U21_003352 [Claviceps maximensis]|nr:hypothetical protein E4U21_003352 [Claviceps maximensis]
MRFSVILPLVAGFAGVLPGCTKKTASGIDGMNWDLTCGTKADQEGISADRVKGHCWHDVVFLLGNP